MSTQERFTLDEITQNNPLFSQAKTTIETAFYANNMQEVSDVATAYRLAKANPKTIVTDLAIQHAQQLGLPSDAKMLVDNHGAIVGRSANARRLLGQDEESVKLLKLLCEAIYQASDRPFYRTQVVVGLDEDFMVKAHFAIPQGYEMNLLSYLLNFQAYDTTYQQRYRASKVYTESDLYIYANPDWSHPDYPEGLALFDVKHNVAAILGLRYFGEFKKATLTLTWALAHRHGYIACHGGAKTFHFENQDEQVLAFYGLSGSGKSTLTHAKHSDKFAITILHDDAFVIKKADGSSVALEPAYFDKTSDYLPNSPEIKYFTTLMNVGVTLDQAGNKVLVTEDLRNGNGRTIKSRYSSSNRIDKEAAPLTAVCWIMKDDSLPPVVALRDPILAATFGVTLATKRSNAENISLKNKDNLVIEPFANPFRAYPLVEDYLDFKELFAKNQVQCYIVNTDSFNGLKIPKEKTLALLEQIVTKQAQWQDFGALPQMQYLKTDDYQVDWESKVYRKKLFKRLQTRFDWVQQYNQQHLNNPLPNEITAKLALLLEALQ
ncbi:phosphoenolpyruvate carboxykinase (ATP) [Ligilactobacillus sp. Marseille-Q7487]|uniref:phosphoenolpyruvate carboxykinase (ATP) n=1 Tax=Ligilactobacillus sp. Marseille-Q7487 TaxID=3022128 RepID=UPI0024AA004D|nr:phosphoenolpyruvate carboxykinase (ATP) [Ligilactobacillus sp. Marseille-Q7487]